MYFENGKLDKSYYLSGRGGYLFYEKGNYLLQLIYNSYDEVSFFDFGIAYGVTWTKSLYS